MSIRCCPGAQHGWQQREEPFASVRQRCVQPLSEATEEGRKIKMSEVSEKSSCRSRTPSLPLRPSSTGKTAGSAPQTLGAYPWRQKGVLKKQKPASVMVQAAVCKTSGSHLMYMAQSEQDDQPFQRQNSLLQQKCEICIATSHVRESLIFTSSNLRKMFLPLFYNKVCWKNNSFGTCERH